MRAALGLVDLVMGRRIQRAARRHVADIAQINVGASRHRGSTLLATLRKEAGTPVNMGRTQWGERVSIPLPFLAKAHATITGGTGSGKTMTALTIIDAILNSPEPEVSFGVLDGKGELFERTLYLIAKKCRELAPGKAQALRDRLVIIDLSSPDPVTSYNIARPWAECDADFFATSRVETLQELLPSGSGLSLRGGSIVKYVLMLLAEHGLPFSYFDRALSLETFRAKLLADSANEELRHYFQHHFPAEGRSTIAAVRARLAAALLGSASLKLALSGEMAPDLRRLQDDGSIVLINCAGPNIARATARTLQALFLSDIRQAVFARKAKRPYLWVCDEAQNFFRTRQLRDNMTDLLTMSRSFGSFFLYLTQNLSSAVQDTEMLETLHTNIRWSLTLRGTSKDGVFLEQALPVTGRKPKPRANQYEPLQFYSVSEERKLLVHGLSHLPDRAGWLWLKSKTGEAMRIETAIMDIPEGKEFRNHVDEIRLNPQLGQRSSRESYLAAMQRRDAKWFNEEEPDTIDKLTDAYSREQLVTSVRLNGGPARSPSNGEGPEA